MANLHITSDELVKAVQDALNDYADDIKDGMKDIALKLGKEGAEELKHNGTFKDRTGNYRKNWTYKDQSTDKKVDVVIHNNKPTYRLTHLLENGHYIRDTGKRTKSYEHIYPVDTRVVREYEKEVKEMIKRGTR